jgi:DNA-binding transcriptional MerR regulator
MSGKIYVIEGKELEMFTIGELAKRLDRQRQTLRKWENNGIIPQAIYRSGANRRLYTKNQIDAIVKCVNEHQIKQGQPIPLAFREDVKEAFDTATEMDFEETISN